MIFWILALPGFVGAFAAGVPVRTTWLVVAALAAAWIVGIAWAVRQEQRSRELVASEDQSALAHA